MTVTLIAAVGRGGAIGRDGALPWHLPEDLAHFKAVTMGHAVVMGRKTWDGLPAKFRPLPGRRNVVVTRDWGGPVGARILREGATEVDGDLVRCLRRDWVGSESEVFVIGGAQVYAEALPLCDRLIITEVDIDVPDADTFFPIGMKCWSKRKLWGGPHDRWLFEFGGEDILFVCTSRRPGTDPRLIFSTWERRR